MQLHAVSPRHQPAAHGVIARRSRRTGAASRATGRGRAAGAGASRPARPARTARSRPGSRPGFRAARTPARRAAPRRTTAACPGLWATRQNTSRTPSASSAGLTWSCGPTDTPPDETTTSAAAIAAGEGALGGRRGRRARSPADDHLGAGPRRLGGDRGRVRLVDLARLERLPGRHQLAAGGQHRDPRPVATSPRSQPDAAIAASTAGVSTPSRPRPPGRRRRCRRRPAGCSAPGAGRSATSPSCSSRVLDRHDRVGARREAARPWRCRRRLPGRQRGRAGRRRRRGTRSAAARRPARPRAPRSRPSPRWRTAAGSTAAITSAASTRPASRYRVGGCCDVRRPAGAASRIISSASSTDSTSDAR